MRNQRSQRVGGMQLTRSIQWPRTYACRDSAAHRRVVNSAMKIPVITHSIATIVLSVAEPGGAGTNARATNTTASAANVSSHATSWRSTNVRYRTRTLAAEVAVTASPASRR